MGTGASILSSGVDTDTPLPIELQHLVDIYSSMGFRAPEILKIRDIFLKYDKSLTNRLSYEEFINCLKLPNDLRARERFCKRCFSFFDPHSTGEIEFDEFLITAWHYCSMKADQFLEFAFDLYDPELRGQIRSNGVIMMLIDLHGENPEMIESARQVLERIEKRQNCKEMLTDIRFTKNDFHSFYQEDTSLLWPAYQLLERMRDGFGGKKFWQVAHKLRTEKEQSGEYPGNIVIKSMKEKAHQRNSRSVSRNAPTSNPPNRNFASRRIRKMSVRLSNHSRIARRMSRKFPNTRRMSKKSGVKLDSVKNAVRRMSTKFPGRSKNNIPSVKHAARKISMFFFNHSSNLHSVKGAARKFSVKFAHASPLNSVKSVGRKMSFKFPARGKNDDKDFQRENTLNISPGGVLLLYNLRPPLYAPKYG
mmetsp:Transcript_21536/g.28269  ORF Transcript_21536/g.28269 Transcript_21536/m.28269 type:complete len:420 (-) Transcript_21536:355-1614(-)